MIRPSPITVVSLLSLALLAASCGERAREASSGPDASGFFPSPAMSDRGGTCADVGDVVRVCFGDADAEGTGCARGVCVAERPVPRVVASDRGFVCVGGGRDRRCRDRRAASLPFVCGDGGCVQANPTLPDDGEWECMDTHGAAVCRHISWAAGVSRASDELAMSSPFVCGMRRGSGEQICVDLAPDTPDGDALAWRCDYDTHRGIRRTCMEAGDEPHLGMACDDDAPCPENAICVAGRCVPPALAPSCWLDTDCGAEGRCFYGSCVEVAP